MDTPESLVGQVLSRSCRLDSLLAEGGASLVFQAERMRPPRRTVAVKLLHPLLVDDEELRARFQHEAEVLGELRHDHVVELIDVGQTDEDLPFHVLELLEGETLRERLDRDGPLSPGDVALLVEQAAAALTALHDLKVVHRDVSPRNLFLVGQPGEEPQVKLMDFALALRSGGERKRGQPEVIGSEGYMSPEQFRGVVHEVDAATDVFALAVVAYEALCGRRPFDAGTEEELLRQVCRADPTPITARVKGLSPEVNQVLARALAKSKGERYDRIETFAAELSAALDGSVRVAPVPAAEQPPVSREPKTSPESKTTPAGEEPDLETPQEAATPEPEEQDLLGGMTLMDTPPSLMDHPPAEPHEEETEAPVPEHVEDPAEESTPQDPSLAGQTLVGEDDLLEELFGGGDDAPSAEAGDPAAEEPGTSPLDRHTVMLPGEPEEPKPDEGEQGDIDPSGRHTLVLPEDAPKPRADETASREPATAGQTLVGEDDLLDELAGVKDKPGADAGAPLGGQTIMDEVIETDADDCEAVPPAPAPASTTPPDVEEPPPFIPPKTRSQEAGKIVTVFQGNAWARAEAMAMKRSQPEPAAPEVAEPPDDMENTLNIDRPAPRRIPLVAVTIAVVVILAIVLFYLSR